MTADLPPFVVFFTGALLLALAPARLHKGLLLLVPVAAGLLLLEIPKDHVIAITVMGHELMP